ncbi:MAG: hypothetical protein J6O18_07150 [Bacilli bacterium]|nr:hypothetical protein [Bacilli bacterium]
MFLCSFTSFGICGETYGEEIAAINKLDVVHEIQAVEFLFEFAYLKSHLEFEYNKIELDDKISVQPIEYSLSDSNEELNHLLTTSLLNEYNIGIGPGCSSKGRITICGDGIDRLIKKGD